MLKRIIGALSLVAFLSAPAVAFDTNPPPFVGAYGGSPVASMARPGNTTTYTVNTGWCLLASACVSVFTFSNACAYAGEQIQIPQIDIYSSKNPSTKLQGVLWLFSAKPGTIVNDDATFNIAAADFANLVGGFNGLAFTLASAQASGAANSGVSLTSAVRAACASGSTSLFGMVQVVNAYVPASAEVLTVQIKTVAIN